MGEIERRIEEQSRLSDEARERCRADKSLNAVARLLPTIPGLFGSQELLACAIDDLIKSRIEASSKPR